MHFPELCVTVPMPKPNLCFAFVLILGVGLLSGCVSDPTKPCPVSGVLGEAEQMTVFQGGGRQPADIGHKVTVSNVKLDCTYRGKKAVDSSISFDITIERGPAAQAGAVTVPYFVAVSRGGKAILAREAFTRTVDIGSRPRETARERVAHIRIPFAEGTLGASYEVVVGLGLTPEQLSYNRERRGH
jgi:hypothetical protein